MSHAITRTSPTGEGQKFIGRCIKCGTEGLGMGDALEDCPQDGKMDEDEVLVQLIEEGMAGSTE